MGLIRGRYYPIEIKRLDEYLWVKIYTRLDGYFRYRPYSSIKKIKENWEMTKTEVRLLNTIHALALDRILFLCEHYKDKGYVTPSELSSFLSLVDDYQTSGGNSSLVNCAKSAVINLINTSVYTPNEYRLAMGMNKIINPLDARMEVEKMFTYVDMDFLNTRYSPSFDVQQSRILDSQAQCNATIMERLRYEMQCK